MKKYAQGKKGGAIVLFGNNLYELVSPINTDNYGNTWCTLRSLKTKEICKASSQVFIPLTIQAYMKYKRTGKI